MGGGVNPPGWNSVVPNDRLQSDALNWSWNSGDIAEQAVFGTDYKDATGSIVGAFTFSASPTTITNPTPQIESAFTFAATPELVIISTGGKPKDWFLWKRRPERQDATFKVRNVSARASMSRITIAADAEWLQTETQAEATMLHIDLLSDGEMTPRYNAPSFAIAGGIKFIGSKNPSDSELLAIVSVLERN